MSLQTVRVTLDIRFDNEEHSHPANWIWADLLDMPPLYPGDEGEGFVLVETQG